ncbi:phosphogluconate dehydrogenase (NAD(+)-dependent, decarboxylating) [Alicyclobacillus contaminans]|uniref:phosphogluconate dehydrogenase (NAD(+)-dependent, decarboxylating) n=1 Tax=Alicyclobacillus contaminans TaxID=392016 RepID=UPI00047B0F24|nr:decarboxylating 6-phosphogluconate dehydrogenase [Alicyclobacillus contaminans]
MKIGLIGLGKMGYNLGLNLMEHGHQVVAYDVSADAVKRFAGEGGTGVDSVEVLVSSLPTPKIVWLMVPAGKIVDDLLDILVPLLKAGDIVIEGGNSHYKDTLRRSERLAASGIHYMDVGTSGGMEGARHGACYMIGGDADVFPVVEPLFRDTAVPGGYLYTGKPGSGHYAKMVHNGIEYGMMAAIGEGFEVLEQSPFDYDYEKLAHVWSHGSVIRGWLMELTERAFSKDPKLESIRGVMHSSGEGKWTVEEALDLQVPVPVIALSLLMRYRSLKDDTFTGKVVAALRNEFGGHAVEKK